MKHLLPLKYLDTVARAGSIRKAAETLAITSTALNRRILDMEQDLGVQIFERLPRGVRLSTAGEIYIQHVRAQINDMERVRSQIADLSGERRGNVSIACSQALLPYFLPEQISTYRYAHPAVTFNALLRDRAAAELALTDLSADLALVFEPVQMMKFQILLTIRQPLHAIMHRDHPLAGKEILRLRECLEYPVALPTENIGVRHLLEIATRATTHTLNPVIKSDSFEFLRHYALAENLLTFQIEIGIPAEFEDSDLISRPLNFRDVSPGLLYFGQLSGRTLSVAAARFAHQMTEALASRFDVE